MSMNLFDNGITQIQFNTPPDRGSADRLAKRQKARFDSNGKRYVIIKNPNGDKSFTLVFPRVPDALVDALRAFRLATSGFFTWWDHNGISHQIQFAASPLRHTPINAHAQRVEMDCESQI